MEQFFNDLITFSYEWAEALVNGLWLGLILTGLIVLVLKFDRRPDGATGYTIWWSTFITIALLPLLFSISDVKLLPSSGQHVSTTTAQASPSAKHAIGTNRSTDISSEQNRTVLQVRGIEIPTATSPVLQSNKHSDLSASTSQVMPIKTDSQTSLGSLFTQLLPAGVFLLWVLISGWLLVRISLAAVRVKKIKQLAQPLEMKYYPCLTNIINAPDHKRQVRVATSDLVDIPMAAGLGAPMVLLPADLIEDISPRDLKSILLHEMAHLQRWDDWTKLAQKLVEAVLFFHPAVIWIGRQLDIQRELACDDVVVEATGQPKDYARCLTRLAQASSPTPTSLMPGALSGREQIFHRIARLVNPGNKSRMPRKKVIGMVSALILTIILSLQVVPVVAFPTATVSLQQLTLAVQLWTADSDEEGEKNDKKQSVESVATEEDSDDDNEDGNIRSYRVNRKSGVSSGYYYQTGEQVTQNDRLFGKASRDYQWQLIKQRAAQARQSAEVYKQKARSLKGRSRTQSKAMEEFYRALERSDSRSKSGSDVWVTPEVKIAPLAPVLTKNGYSYGWSVPDAPAPKVSYYDTDGSGFVYLSELPDLPDLPELPDLPSLPALPALPDMPYAPMVYSYNNGLLNGLFGFGRSGTTVSNDGGRTSVVWNKGRTKIAVESEGEIELTDDGRGIKSISKRGYVSIYHKRGSWKRELEIEAGSGGEFKYYSEVDGDEAEFDAEGQEWLVDILVEVFRKTGLAAEQRVAIILKNNGVDGVLNETEEIESDWVTRLYLQELIATADISDSEHKRILDQIDREIDSDYEKAELLIYLADEVDDSDKLLTDYLSVLKSLDSDYETRRVLSSIGVSRNADKATVKAVLDLAGQMDSDYEKAELLIEFSRHCRNDAELTAAYTRACRRIDSDYEIRRVLQALGDGTKMDQASLAEVIRMAEMMDSDYEKAELLIEFSDQYRDNPELTMQLLSAASTLDSDYETRRVLEAFEIDCRREPALAEKLLQIASRMRSDYEQAELLIQWAECARTSETALDNYLEAIDRLDSDYERRRVIDELIEAGEVDDKLARELLRATAEISSDYEKAQILNELLDVCNESEELQNEFEEVLESISSDYERDRLYRKLYKRSRQNRGSGK